MCEVVLTLNRLLNRKRVGDLTSGQLKRRTQRTSKEWHRKGAWTFSLTTGQNEYFERKLTNEQWEENSELLSNMHEN